MCFLILSPQNGMLPFCVVPFLVLHKEDWAVDDQRIRHLWSSSIMWSFWYFTASQNSVVLVCLPPCTWTEKDPSLKSVWCMGGGCTGGFSYVKCLCCLGCESLEKEKNLMWCIHSPWVHRSCNFPGGCCFLWGYDRWCKHDPLKKEHPHRLWLT